MQVGDASGRSKGVFGVISLDAAMECWLNCLLSHGIVDWGLLYEVNTLNLK